jgi:aryl sulfotransferase
VSGILWIASYPKSGNTWFRAFVENLRRDGGQPVDINDLQIVNANRRRMFDDATGVESSELTPEEIARLCPRVYRYIAEQSAETVFLKIHNACTVLPDGTPFIPPEATAGAIYIIRNPLDVAISLAHHVGKPLDSKIATMASSDGGDPSDIAIEHFGQDFLSWSGHVLSWIDQQAFPVHVVRYEDMQERPIETFTAAARFCGLPCDPDRVRRAIHHSSFEALQRQERETGFRERPVTTSSFFRQGKAGGWRDVLSPSQVAQIVEEHGPVMRRFGYLPS